MATEQIPDELISEILPWLPVKSLKRFRCLSKPICALIDSPHFVKLHLSKSESQNPNFRKLIFQHPSKKKFHVCNLNPNQEQEVIRLENPVSSPWKLVYGYSKGLLLLYRGKFKFALWNPSTRQSRNIPEVPLKAPTDNQYTIMGSGLAYDDSIDDFKAFCIVHVRQNRDVNILLPKFDVEVWICGLKANIWRKSQTWKFPYLSCFAVWADHLFPGIGCFIPTDGVIYWVCTIDSYIHEIVAFDVKKETYSILPPPDCLLNSDSVKRHIKHPLSTTLHVLEGCLCISYFNTKPLQADLYMRRKVEGDQFAWTQLFSIREPLFVDKVWFKAMRVLGYLKRGDKIMLDIGMDCLVSFDLKEKTFGKVLMDKNSNWKAPIMCIESLVPLS